ncbi:MAG: hypothetical protein RMJ87_04375 [Cytophagales bacterium]|nr:hypothetical protein [Bernardetiaceae bacterium]MDW8204246.1 hypothetical protein [Cytophagales bacterium]
MKLDEIPKNEPIFHVPTNYFDTLPQRVLRRVHNPTSVPQWHPRLLRFAYYLAAICLIVGIGIYKMQLAENYSQQTLSVEEMLIEYDISETDLIDYKPAQANLQEDELLIHADEYLLDVSEEDIIY